MVCQTQKNIIMFYISLKTLKTSLETYLSAVFGRFRALIISLFFVKTFFFLVIDSDRCLKRFGKTFFVIASLLASIRIR